MATGKKKIGGKHMIDKKISPKKKHRPPEIRQLFENIRKKREQAAVERKKERRK